MATPRLPFLYPQLVRSARTYESGVGSLRSSATFQVHAKRHQSAVSRRQTQSTDPTKSPPPALPKKRASRQASSASVNRSGVTKPPKESATPESTQAANDLDRKVKDKEPAKENSNVNIAPSTAASEPLTQDPAAKNETQAGASKSTVDSMPREVPPPKNPLDAVLQMPPPSDMGLTRMNSTGQEIPHLEPAPYIHHFDTYTLVKDLQQGGFSEDQAITLMKGIRGILQEKLDLAEATLTSKSDSENEEYLFKAACSELRSSLEASRHLEVERQRTSRTQLQHEVDILSMRVTQELAKMNDDLKGMWNDHKMTTREQQQGQDTGIQELDYKIAVSLASDGKSEAEELRWVLTRRAAFAIVFSAMMAITFLKFWSTRSRELERKQAVAKETAKLEPMKDAAMQPELSLSDTLASETLG